MLLCGPAGAVDRASDAAEFKGYVDVCKDNTDERGVEGCIADQVGARTSYLGDILSETAGELTPKQEKLLDASERAFEAYLKAACRYQVARTPGDQRAQMFCVLRLTNQRIADVLEGSDFLVRD
jgi:hypothetical protein